MEEVLLFLSVMGAKFYNGIASLLLVPRGFG